MFDQLGNLGYGLVTFAIIIGVGTIVLSKFGDSVGGEANVTTTYLQTQLGTAGLAGWTPAIIALSVGMLFLGVFLTKGGGRSI